MKGALQVAVMMVSALPVQKWLLCLGAVIMTAGYLLPLFYLGGRLVLKENTVHRRRVRAPARCPERAR